MGLGLGRTGTLSLKVALEQLGFSPCYHMLDVIKKPGNINILRRVGEGNPIEWKKLFEKYQAGVDFPFTTHYKEILGSFPGIKVILTVRDPDEWYQSAEQTIYRLQYFLINWLPKGKKVGKKTIWHKLFNGRFHDRDFAIKQFNRHIEDVKQSIPEDQLLIFDVKDGWEPVCCFLEVPVPEGAFPHVNQRAAMKSLMFFVFLFSMMIFISLGYLVYLLL